MPTDLRSLGADPLDVAPSLHAEIEIRVVAHDDDLDGIEALSIPVTESGDVPGALGVDREGLRRAGFTPSVGSALAFPGSGVPVLVAVGIGEGGTSITRPCGTRQPPLRAPSPSTHASRPASPARSA